MPKLIYTDHAIERMYQRNIKKRLVRTAIDKPDKKRYEDDGDTQFIKRVSRGGTPRNIHVVAKPMPDEGDDAWLIKTLWIRGEDDPNIIVKTLRMLWMRLTYRK